jgi:hypothetical protein
VGPKPQDESQGGLDSMPVAGQQLARKDHGAKRPTQFGRRAQRHKPAEVGHGADAKEVVFATEGSAACLMNESTKRA